jgi:hypothetical protein
VDEGLVVADGDAFGKDCEVLRTIELLRFAIKPALSFIWQ